MGAVDKQRPNTAAYGAYEMYKAVHRQQADNVNKGRFTYTEKFVGIIDASLLADNRYIFSKEQERYMNRYYSEADTGLSDEMKQFDEFLAGYREEIADE